MAFDDDVDLGLRAVGAWQRRSRLDERARVLWLDVRPQPRTVLRDEHAFGEVWSAAWLLEAILRQGRRLGLLLATLRYFVSIPSHLQAELRLLLNFEVFPRLLGLPRLEQQGLRATLRLDFLADGTQPITEAHRLDL